MTKTISEAKLSVEDILTNFAVYVNKYHKKNTEPNINPWADLLVTKEERKGHSLKHYFMVAQHLRQYARDKFAKPDKESYGFYEAIKEIEQYFGVSEEMLKRKELYENTKS